MLLSTQTLRESLRRRPLEQAEPLAA
jgi:hypothetical protein